MKKFLLFFIIVIFVLFSFCFVKYRDKSIDVSSLLNNKNHEYVLAIIQSSADNKKRNYLSDFYFDKMAQNQKTAESKNQQSSMLLIKDYNNLVHRDRRINHITRAEIYYFIGNVYMHKKDYANACYCYKKALYFSPYNIGIKYNVREFIKFVDRRNVTERLWEVEDEKSI